MEGRRERQSRTEESTGEQRRAEEGRAEQSRAEQRPRVRGCDVTFTSDERRQHVSDEMHAACEADVGVDLMEGDGRCEKVMEGVRRRWKACEAHVGVDLKTNSRGEREGGTRRKSNRESGEAE